MRADSFNPAVKYGARWYPDNMVIAPPTAGDYLFVDGNKSTGGSGTSWEDAFSTIQAAVDDASRGDIIMIAPKATNGYYTENVKIGGTTATEYGLCGLHLMGVTNNLKNVRIRAAAGTTLYPYSSLSGVSILGACIFVNCAGIEISNLCLDGEGDYYTGIYWGDGSRPFSYSGQTDAMNGSVHDCTFMFGTIGIDYDGCSNDQHCYNNYFYKQTDVGVYIGPGGLQQASRVNVYNNRFIGCEDYGVYIYSHAQNKNHSIGPFNVFADQLHGTTPMASVSSSNATPTNVIVGNFQACTTEHALGTHDIGSGNFASLADTTENVAED